jgi:hypothetical protein
MTRTLPACLLLVAACAAQPVEEAPTAADGKGDTGYQTSGTGRELEVDLEGEVATDGGLERAPIALAQFAMTWLRKEARVYLMSLAEIDGAEGRVEWSLDGRWLPIAQIAEPDRARLRRFRLRGLDAVIADGSAIAVGTSWRPILPLDPWRAGSAACTDGIDASDPAWYAWEPARPGCAEATQRASVTVSRLPPRGSTTYPEYDRLVADGRIEALVVFGQVGHELRIAADDYGYTQVTSFAAWLTANGFAAAPAEVGLRFERQEGRLTEVVDVFGPSEFAGLKDTAHYASFVRAFVAHEIVVYNGHSMLGQSAFFEQPALYELPRYQVLLYNGCLGYEYYVQPILRGKGGWDDVDIVSNVVETSVTRHFPETTLVLTQLWKGALAGGTTSWQAILERMNAIVNHEGFYGAAGIRTNRFQPAR